MHVMRTTKWLFVGVTDGLLKFQNIKFPNNYYLTPRAKYVNVSRNKVDFLDASSISQEEITRYLKEYSVDLKTGKCFKSCK